MLEKYALSAVPSALVQLMLMPSTIAPAKSAGVVTIRELGSVVCTVHVLSPLLTPALNVQPAGTPLIVTVTC